MVRAAKRRAEQKDTPGQEAAGVKAGGQKQRACGRDGGAAVVGPESTRGGQQKQDRKRKWLGPDQSDFQMPC